MQNGELLSQIDQEYDVFLTADKNLRYQRDLRDLNIAIIEFPSNKLSVVKNLVPQIKKALSEITSGVFVQLIP